MKKVYLIFIVIVLVLIACGTGILIALFHANDEMIRKVELESEGNTERELAFSAENFLPGDVREYTVVVHCEKGGEFRISFTCRSVKESELQNYLTVEIGCGEVRKQVALADLFGGVSLGFDVAIQDGATAEFTVRYEMPVTVGNEAQGKTADFLLVLSAQRM